MKLEDLEIEDFFNEHSWRAINEETELEPDLEPAKRNSDGQILKENGECWSLCQAIFNNGQKFYAVSRCRADVEDFPFNWSFHNFNDFQPLYIAPAPQFVLDLYGPYPFSKKFNLEVSDVFPISLSIIDKFELFPHTRSIFIGEHGLIEGNY